MPQEAREEVEEDLYLLEHALRRLLSFKVRAYMLTVNGKDIAPLESKEAVEKVTELAGRLLDPKGRCQAGRRCCGRDD